MQIREGWFDLFHYWWKLPGGLCASRLIGVFRNSVSCGEHGARWTHITLVFGSTATVFQLAWLYFFSVCFFCFHPQPIKTLWSAPRYRSAAHMSVLPEKREGAVALVPCDACHLRLIIRWFGSLFLERWHHLCLTVMVTVYKYLSITTYEWNSSHEWNSFAGIYNCWLNHPDFSHNWLKFHILFPCVTNELHSANKYLLNIFCIRHRTVCWTCFIWQDRKTIIEAQGNACRQKLKVFWLSESDSWNENV